MTDSNLIITCAAAGLAGMGMLTTAILSGWRGWLALKQLEIAGRGTPVQHEPSAPSTASRIELADLKERIRKLEAIAAGVDL